MSREGLHASGILLILLSIGTHVQSGMGQVRRTRFESAERWGYRDSRGHVVIRPRFIVAGEFSPEGIAAVVDSSGWAYIDSSGEIIIRPFVFDNGPDTFREGLARNTLEGRFGFFDRGGKKVLEPQFDYADPFHEGRAAICQGCTRVYSGEHWSMRGGKWGYIDKKGKLTIPLRYDHAGPFQSGKARVRRDGEIMYIDGKGAKLPVEAWLDELMERKWEEVRPRFGAARQAPEVISWTRRSSPPFPRAWPLAGNSELHFYFYAQGMDISGGLVDAVRVAAPWARVTVDLGQQSVTEVQMLSDKLEELGIQGVQPLAREEQAICDNIRPGEAFLRMLSENDDEKTGAARDLKEYYCLWSRCNGVMVERIRPPYRLFFRWLGCE